MVQNDARRMGVSAGVFLCFLSFLVFAQSVQATLITGSEEVSGTRKTDQYTDGDETYGPYEWTYSYTRGFDGEKLYKHVEIEFVFDTARGWDDATKAKYKTDVETGIEAIWNNKYYLIDNDTQKLYPLVVDVTTAGPFNQTVTVHDGEGRADMLNWYEDDSFVVNAHEFGHMLGLFDEYMGGAVNRYPNPLLSADGLMGLGALNDEPVMYERYYQQYLDYMNTLNKGGDFGLRQVPEPSAFVLAGVGLIVLAALQRRPGCGKT